MIKLTPRLQLVADMVNKCESFLDVGTDHAYLPAYLIEQLKTKHAIASDINPNPLENAKKTISEENVEASVELRLSDGFCNIGINEAQEIAIAGMGGIMIADMITNTAWLKSCNIHLVLQPMTHCEKVRQALADNGFETLEEKTVAEGKRIYIVISARYKGKIENKPLYWYYIGNLLHSKSDTDREYAEKTLKSLKKKYDGIKKTGKEDIKTLEIIRSIENAYGN